MEWSETAQIDTLVIYAQRMLKAIPYREESAMNLIFKDCNEMRQMMKARYDAQIIA